LTASLKDRDPQGEFSVYFFPFSHGGDFILETKVKFVEGTDIRDVEAQLLTRDSNQINSESGVAFFAEENKVTVRHMVKKIDQVWETVGINMNVTYGEWYTLRFMFYEGTIKVFVNGVQVYISNGAYPVGEYREPHLAVRYGVARFEHVTIARVIEED